MSVMSRGALGSQATAALQVMVLPFVALSCLSKASGMEFVLAILAAKTCFAKDVVLEIVTSRPRKLLNIIAKLQHCN